MKKLLLIILIMGFILNISFGQKWTYNSGGNVFDGKYKSCIVEGTGGKYPYNNPLFVINSFDNGSNLNIYINKVGYAGCDNKIAYIKFDKEPELYTYAVATNSEKDVWFINNGSTSRLDLLEKMKSHNIIYVRLSSDCGQSDYEFTLSGSSVAINYVLTDYIKALKRKKEKLKGKEIINNKIKELISSGDTLKGKANIYVNVLFAPTISAFYKECLLKEGDEIIISLYAKNKDFYILHKTSRFQLPNDSTFYIRKSGVNIETIETIKD